MVHSANAPNGSVAGEGSSQPGRERQDQGDSGLGIWMVTPEAVPFAKTGGLADAVGGLSWALARLGHRLTVVLPRYRGVKFDKPDGGFNLRLGPADFNVQYAERVLGEGVRALLVDVPELFDREGLYGAGGSDYPDNARRFAVLSRAAVALASSSPDDVSVLHAHDWQAGLVPLYVRHENRAPKPATVFTIHNLGFQGLFSPDALADAGLPGELLSPAGLEFWGRVSFLKAGVVFADMITTVSRRYAREILTPELGFGFDGILAARKDRLEGIPNGIDETRWSPEHDPYLPRPFSAEDLSGKRDAKRALLQAFGLPADGDALEQPVVGLVSRMADQKGFDLLAELESELPVLGAVFVVLGMGEQRYEMFWTGLADRFPDRIAVRIGFDERLAHLIEAGSDLFLMPSRFEPCGSNQMYSLRYGTVPVVRATGGLDDTVEEFEPETGRGNGFKFGLASSQALLETLGRALTVFRRKDGWRRLQLAGMRQDFSWGRSAEEYVKVYRRALASAPVGT